MSEWDDLKVCRVCGNAYTTGELCADCARQAAIDMGAFEDSDGVDHLEYLPDNGDEWDEYDDEYDDPMSWDDYDGMVFVPIGSDVYTNNLRGLILHAIACLPFRARYRYIQARMAISRRVHKMRYRLDTEYRQRVDSLPF